MDHRRLPGDRAGLVVLAIWNGAVAVVFGIGALTWLVASMYARSVGGDVFGDNDRSP